MPLIATVILVTIVAAMVGVVLQRAGFFESAPELPAFARPIDAEQLSNSEISCIRNDWFGPYLRELVFGTNTPYEAQLAQLAQTFRSRGRGVQTRDTPTGTVLLASHGDGGTSISYRDASFGKQPQLGDDYPVVVEVVVTDECT